MLTVLNVVLGTPWSGGKSPDAVRDVLATGPEIVGGFPRLRAMRAVGGGRTPGDEPNAVVVLLGRRGDCDAGKSWRYGGAMLTPEAAGPRRAFGLEGTGDRRKEAGCDSVDDERLTAR